MICPTLGVEILAHDRDTCPACLRKDRDAYLANLTATQARCNELLEEARAARRELVIALHTSAALAAEVYALTKALEP